GVKATESETAAARAQAQLVATRLAPRGRLERVPHHHACVRADERGFDSKSHIQASGLTLAAVAKSTPTVSCLQSTSGPGRPRCRGPSGGGWRGAKRGKGFPWGVKGGGHRNIKKAAPAAPARRPGESRFDPASARRSSSCPAYLKRYRAPPAAERI